jgi:signal transduction histidine kinase
MGRKEYIIGMGIDISARIRAENELRERTQEIQKLTAYLERVREEERTRIAREIHDELGQQLTGLKMDAVWISKRRQEDTDVFAAKIQDMIALIDETIRMVRRISSELRPGILDDLGLMAALEWQTQDFGRRTGIKAVFQTSLSDFRPDRDVATNVFRVFQEILTNVARHAEATQVEANLIRSGDEVLLTVADNGKGFNPDTIGEKSTLGLIGMHERVLLFGGRLDIESGSDRGTRITLHIPFSINQEIHDEDINSR